MKIRLLAFGIARDILRARTLDYVLLQGNTIGELRAALAADYSALGQLASLSFAVNEEYAGDTKELREGDEVVLIPPVSGG